MKNKIIGFVLVVLLLIIGLFFSFIYKEKKTQTKQPAVQNQQPQNNEKKDETKHAEEAAEETTEEVAADPELVTVGSSSGAVTKISEESITINTGEKEETYNLIEKDMLGIFKGTGDNVTIITLNEIKAGDRVTLEVRQSDNAVNVIMVE